MLVLRRLRGIFGTALVWAIVWGVLGSLLVLGLSVWDHFERDPGRSLAAGRVLLAGFLFFAIWGTISGAVFAMALALAERRRSVHELSMRRVVGWGVLGGITIPLVGTALSFFAADFRVLPSDTAIMFALTALLGGLCAGGTLALVRAR